EARCPDPQCRLHVRAAVRESRPVHVSATESHGGAMVHPPCTGGQMTEKPSSVFVTYIVTTAEKLWEALTNGEITKQYFFGRRMESDWEAGSPWKLMMEDDRIDCQGKVLE